MIYDGKLNQSGASEAKLVKFSFKKVVNNSCVSLVDGFLKYLDT